MSNKLTTYALLLGVVAIILSAVALFNSHAVPFPKLAGTVENFTAYPYGLQLNNIAFNTKNGTIGAGANQANFQNTGLGRKIYIDKILLETTGTATSTYKFFAYASTTATNVSDFVAPIAPYALTFQMATSSTATTTTNLDISAGTNRSGIAGLTIADGSYFNIQMQAVDKNCTSAQDAPTIQLCSSATSTDRGFNINWRIFYHYIP